MLYRTCQLPIACSPANNLTNTYCMRPVNHPGKCAPEPTEEDKKESK